MHEHLDAFGIINMSGRVYDPLTAQFFSPDPYVQAPGNWLNFNRYAYCYGNPFKYTDPDGEWIQYVVGAVVGGTINWITNGAEFSWSGLSYFGAGAVAGAITALAPHSYAVISAGLSASNNFIQQSFDPSVGFKNVNYTQVAFQGIIGGATAYAGSEFGKALQVDKWVAGIESPLLRSMTQNTLSNSIVGGTFGGLKSASNGGSFWDGAWSGVKMGLVTGTISGIGGAVTYSKENNVNLLTGKSNTVKQTGNYTVYSGIDPDTGETRYIGITERDPKIRFDEHKNSNSPRSNLDYAPIEGATNLSKIDARIMEQNYINQYRMIKNGGVLYNQRNSIAPKFWDNYNIKR